MEGEPGGAGMVGKSGWTGMERRAVGQYMGGRQGSAMRLRRVWEGMKRDH